MADEMAFGTAEYGSEERGRCHSCGFLGQRGIMDVWFTASPELRAAGWFPLGPRGQDGKQTYVEPGCIVGAASLETEYRAATKAAPQGTTFEVIGKQVTYLDRKCPQWFPFQPGLSPKEHVERYHVLQLERERYDLQMRLAQMEGEANAQSVKIAEALRDTASRTEKFTTRWTYAAFVIALLGVLLIAATYLFPDFGRGAGEWILGQFGR